MLSTASVWASSLSSSTLALADDSPTQKVQSASTGANSAVGSDRALDAAPASPSSEQLAAIAYKKARASYADGDVPGALTSMRESYELSKKAELLYNLAQLEQELNSCADALADYRRYLELVPHGLHRASAAQARDSLEKICPPAAPTSTVPAPISGAPKPATTDGRGQTSVGETGDTGYWTTPRVIGWSAIATGTLTGTLALYFQLQAIHAKDEFQQSNDAAEAGGPAVDTSLEDRQHKYNRMAIAFGITGGALVASGALVLLFDPGTGGQRSRSVSLCALPGLVGASYTQHF